MRLATVCTYLMALASLSHAAARTVHFVADGAAKDIREAGQPWTRGKGYLESSGVGNVLRAGHRLGAGDFVVRARLSLARLERTAASFTLGNVHFGFDGHPTGRLFIEGGPFGKAQLLADATEFLAPGEPFLLEVRRQGSALSFAINGKLAHRATFRKSAIPSMGLRPHRGTMRVYEFSATGKLTPLRSNEMGDVSDMVLAEVIEIAGQTMHTASPPAGLVLREELGLVTSRFVDGQVVHRTPHPGVGLFEVKGTITPRGDYLLMFPEGQHYGGKWKKVNTLLAYRSSDKGKTWTGPTATYDIPYSQHGFIPLIPRGTKRLYCFGTQPMLEKAKFDGRENATIGFRHSDNDGRTWSDVTLIRPTNDPGFLGMSVMRMCETDAGTWLVGSHEADWTKKPLMTRQYILRSEDKGRTWTVLPDKRPGGWFEKQHNRMDELRPINLGGGKVLALARTCEGHLWELRSDDDGKTWSDPKPTALVHPDAPPMLFHLADGKTLVAFHHNRHTGTHFKQTDRAELWVATSTDEGHTWSEPRFVLANALDRTLENDWYNCQCSYVDMFPDGDTLNILVPHRWRQVLHLRVQAADLARLPTKADLVKAARTP